MARADLEKKFKWFAYAQDPKQSSDFQYVPQAMEAFVWGDKWRDQSKNLPGLVSGWQLFTGIALDVGMAFVSAGIGAAAKGATEFAKTAMGSWLHFH